MINYDKFISDGGGITIIQNNGKEQHRYIPNYPLETGLEYLIIGTIHPNSKPIIDYYYGNVASFWKIIEVIYPTYSFDSPRKIRDWQSDFKIGITDTIIQCRRKKQTPLDSDLIVDDEDYNWALKDYVIDNCKSLKCFLFTSGEGKNAAYKNLKKIMGKEFEIVRNKCIVLPSPSGSSTLSFFKGKDEHYGLVLPFYNFLKSNHPEVLAIAKETFNLKKQTKKAVKRLPETGINYYDAYRVFEYRKHLPTKSL